MFRLCTVAWALHVGGAGRAGEALTAAPADASLAAGLGEDDAEPEASPARADEGVAAFLLVPVICGLLVARQLAPGRSGDVVPGMAFGLLVRFVFGPQEFGPGAAWAVLLLPSLCLRTWNLDLGLACGPGAPFLGFLLVGAGLPVASTVACGQALKVVAPFFGFDKSLWECCLVFAALNANGGGAAALLLKPDNELARSAVMLLWWQGMCLTGPLFRAVAEGDPLVLFLDVGAGLLGGAGFALLAAALLPALPSDRLRVLGVVLPCYLCSGVQALGCARNLPSAEVLSAVTFVLCLKHRLERQGGSDCEPLVADAAASLSQAADTALFFAFGAAGASGITGAEVTLGLLAWPCVYAGFALAPPAIALLAAWTGAGRHLLRPGRGLFLARNAVWVACHAHPQLTLAGGERLGYAALLVHALSVAVLQVVGRAPAPKAGLELGSRALEFGLDDPLA